MARVIFVNRFYWPETPATGQLLADLASGLARTGWTVTVITSAGRDGVLPRTENHDGVTIERVPTPRVSGASIPGKASAFGAFALGAAWRLLRGVRRGDIVVCLTDPPLFGILAGWIARMKGARIVHWLQDIYPDIAVALIGHGWLSATKLPRDRAWRGADHCVTLSAEMAEVVTDAGVADSRVTVIPNWPPRGLVPVAAGSRDVAALRAAWGLDGRFVVSYSGNLGRVHDLEPLIEAADVLRDDASIVFLFVGRGAQWERLAQQVEKRHLPNVVFRPPQPRDALTASLAVADVHLVTIRPGCERFVFPSKLYGVAAVGRPVLMVGPPDCELARIVRDEELGVTANRDQPDAIVSAIRVLAASAATRERFADAAVRFASRHTSDAAVSRWQDVLRRVEAC